MSWKPLVLALRSLAAAATVLALLGAGALWRAADAPLSLGFLSPRAAALLAVPRHGIRAEPDDVVLFWSWWNRDLEVRVAGLRFRDRNGRQVAHAETAIAEVDLPAFARHWIARFDLARATRPSPGEENGAEDGAAPLGPEHLPDIAASAHAANPFLKRLAVRNASLAAGFPEILEIDVARTASGFAGTFRLGAGAGLSRGTASWDATAESGDLAMNLDGLPLGRLAAALAGDPRIPAAALSGRLSLRYDGETRIARVALGEGAGTVAFSGAEPVAFSGLEARGFVDVAARRLFVDGAAVSLGGTGIAVRNAEASFGETVAVSGSVEAERLPPALLDAVWPPRAGAENRSWAVAHLRDAGAIAADVALRFDRGDGSVRFDVSSGPGRIAAPDGTSTALRFDRLVLGGRYDRAERRLSLDDTALVFDRASLTLRNAEAVFGEDAAVRVRVETDPMPLAALATFWPPGTASGAREWAFGNLRDGTVSRIAADVAARIGIGRDDMGEVEIEALSGEAELEGFTVSYLRPLDPVRGADAKVTFGDGRADFELRSGRAGALRIRGGKIGVRGLGGERETMSVSVSVDGPVADALATLDHPRLGLLSRISRDGKPPVAPRTVGGTHATRLDLGFPLLADLDMDDIDLSAVSNLSGLSVPRIFGGRSLENGAFALRYGKGRMTASGTAEIADRPVRILWRERFDEDRSTTISGSLAVDEELAEELSVGRFLDGTAKARLVYRRDGAAPATLDATLDVADAALDVPAFDRIKEPNRPGTITLGFRPDGGGFGELVEAALRTGDLAGRARKDGDAWRVEVDYGRTSFSGAVRRGEDGVHAIDVAGAGFDAARLFEKMKAEGTPTRRPFRLAGAFGNLWVEGELPLIDARLVLDRTRDGWRQIHLDAVLPGGNGAIRAEMAAVPGGHDLFADIEDAGMFLDALGVSDALQGEGATLRARRRGSAEEPWKGRVETGRIRVTRVPFLARLLQLLSPSGLLATFRSEGIAFEEAVVPFAFRDGVTEISDAKVVGDSLSLTASGTLDVDEDRLDLSGTVIPAPLLNRLLESIPVIGPLAAGGTNRGVFAANYRARGPIDDPEVRVNPLSLLAPGFIRELFGDLLEALEETPEPGPPENP